MLRWIRGVLFCLRQPIALARSVVRLLLFLLLLGVTAQTALAQTIRLQVGIYNNPPLSYVDDQGEPQGLVVELLQQVALKEGWQLEFVPCEWLSCLNMLESGEIDVLGAIAYTEERSKRFDFNEQAYFANWGVVYTRPDNSIQSLVELDGKTIAAVDDDIYTLGVRDLLYRLGLQAFYLSAEDYDAVFEMVASGQADAGVVARLYGLMNEGNYRVRASPIILSPIQLRYAATKGKHRDILGRIDFHLETWKQTPDSPYFQALNRWLNYQPSGRKLPPWLGWALGGLATWALVAVVSIFFLQRRIGAQTRALQAEREYLQAVLDSVDGVFIYDADQMTILDVNQRACELYGYSRSELLNLSPGALCLGKSPYSKVEAMNWLHKARLHGPQTFEWQARHRDGHLFWVEMSIRYALIGGKERYVAAVRDVTKQKEAREKLSATEVKLRTLLEQVPAVTYTESAVEKGKTLYISPQIVTLLGHWPADWIDELYGWQKYVYPDDLERVIMEDEQSLEREAPFSSEYRLVKASGEFIWVHDEAVLVRDEDGRPLFWQGVMYDITARKQAEERTQQHLTELQALYENGMAIGRLLDPGEISKKLVENLSRCFGWQYIAIYLRRSDEGELELIASTKTRSAGRNAVQKINRVGQRCVDLAVQSGSVIRVDDLRSQPHLGPVFSKARSGMYVPLKVGERVVGCVSVESGALSAFSEQDERLLAALSVQAAVAFDNARLYQQAVKDGERRVVLHRASQEIVSSGLDLESLYFAIHQAVTRLMPADIFAIALLDEAQQDIDGVYFVEGGKRYPRIRFKREEGLSGYVLQTNQSLRIDDYAQQAGELPFEIVLMQDGLRPRSVLAVPLRFGAKVIGVMLVQSHQPALYTAEDQILLEMLAAYAGYALENARLLEAERNQRQLSEALRDALGAGASLSNSLEFDIVLDRLLETLERVVPFDGGCIMLVEPESRSIRIAKTRGYRNVGRRALDGIRQLRFEVASTANLRWVYENRQPLIIPDVRKYPGWIRVKEAPFVRSWAGAPIVVNDEVVAIFSLDGYQSGLFTDEHALLLKAYTGQASLALQNALLFEQTRRRADRLAVLNEVSSRLAGLMSVESVGETIVPVIQNLLGWTRGSVWLVDENGALTMLYHSTPGLEGEAREKEVERLRNLIPKPGVGITGWVIQTGEVVRCGNVKHDPRYVEGHPAIRSELCAPLRIQDRIIGCLNFESERENAFTEEDEQVIITLAAEIAGAIERARLYEQTRRRADELAELAAENERLLAETQQRLQFVSALHTIDAAIASSLDIRLTLSVILDHVLAHLDVDVAAIYLLNPHLRELEFAAGRGAVSDALHVLRLPLSEPIVASVVVERKMVQLPDLTALQTPSRRQKLALAERFVFYAAHPLIVKGEVKGMLEVLRRAPLKTDTEWAEYLQSLAGQAALAIDASAMFSDLQRANVELSMAYDATIEGWSNALDLRDQDTEGHTQRVTDLTLRLARQMGLGESELVHIWRGSLLHDIGKMGVPDSILRKPGPLTEGEMRVMRRHPEYAFDLLSRISYLRPALDIPYCHHERWNGSGYPRGLKGEQIPLPARIFAVVDVWDALCSDRPYRKAWSPELALEYIVKNSGVLFDPRVVEAFVSMIRST